MRKSINKKGLILDFTDKDDKKVIDENYSKENIDNKEKSIIPQYSDSLSYEIGKEDVIFKKNDIAVTNKGVKNITTGKFISCIDSRQIEVKLLYIRY